LISFISPIVRTLCKNQVDPKYFLEERTCSRVGTIQSLMCVYSVYIYIYICGEEGRESIIGGEN